MKVRVTYTTDVPDEFRLALAHSWGYHRKATRAEIQRHLEMVGSNEDEDIMQEWNDDPCKDCSDD